MKQTIKFTNFMISDTGFTCTVESSKMGGGMDELSYVLSPVGNSDSSLDKDSIAYALSTLCGKTYANIFIDLQISEQCCVEIATFTGATVKTAGHEIAANMIPSDISIWNKQQTYDYNSEEGVILSFSGGFDSLAAMAILSDVPGLHLVSIDFGGYFDRERNFFSSFPTNIVHTNFRQLKYDREHWTFMGTGAILFAKMLNAKHHVFGTILEATYFNFHSGKHSCATPPISYVGLDDWYVTQGLTEVATIMIVSYYYPNKVNLSLKSLASPGSEKLWRKYLLGTIVCDRYERNVDLEKQPFPKESEIKPFGRELARDFLALYELKHVSREAVEKTLCEIPQKVNEFIKGFSLDFYEKFNTSFLYTLPQTIQDSVLRKLEEAGILKDWEEFEEVKKFLSEWHHQLIN